MKLGLISGIVVVMAMFVCVDARAQSDDESPIRESVTLTQAAALGGQQLEAGKYDAEISGGEIVLKRSKNEVARARDLILAPLQNDLAPRDLRVVLTRLELLPPERRRLRQRDRLSDGRLVVRLRPRIDTHEHRHDHHDS
jgi:hypothetical protein